MSFDKQNFARTVQEQQAGISPQMWPIKIDPGDGPALSLNSVFEVDINPCDCVWLPYTFDKSYGYNPIQGSPYASQYPDPTVIGANIYDSWDTSQQTYLTSAPVFGLRFNSPNNPWLVWGLGVPQPRSGLSLGGALAPWGVSPGHGRLGASSLMRSITGPISRLWCQFYQWAYTGASGFVPYQYQQVMLLSMLGFSQQSDDFQQPVNDATQKLTGPPIEYRSLLSCGGYRTSDLNSADLRVLGQNPMPVAPTTSGKGSATG